MVRSISFPIWKSTSLCFLLSKLLKRIVTANTKVKEHGWCWSQWPCLCRTLTLTNKQHNATQALSYDGYDGQWEKKLQALSHPRSKVSHQRRGSFPHTGSIPRACNLYFTLQGSHQPFLSFPFLLKHVGGKDPGHSQQHREGSSVYLQTAAQIKLAEGEDLWPRS